MQTLLQICCSSSKPFLMLFPSLDHASPIGQLLRSSEMFYQNFSHLQRRAPAAFHLITLQTLNKLSPELDCSLLKDMSFVPVSSPSPRPFSFLFLFLSLSFYFQHITQCLLPGGCSRNVYWVNKQMIIQRRVKDMTRLVPTGALRTWAGEQRMSPCVLHYWDKVSVLRNRNATPLVT